MFSSFLLRAWAARGGGRPGGPAGHQKRATAPDLLAADAEPLLGPVAGRLLLPGLQARVEAGLAGVGLADRAREDAIGVDLEGQVRPARQHLRRRLREDLVDLLTAEVSRGLVQERRRVEHGVGRREVARVGRDLLARAGVHELQEPGRRELVLA